MKKASVKRFQDWASARCAVADRLAGGPALKLSQGRIGFYEISTDLNVDNGESQGCLSQPKLMHAQDIDHFPPRLVQVPRLKGLPKFHQTWQCVPLNWLQNFELVADQFAGFGLHFEDAIAICPSNPRFNLHSSDRVVMPTKKLRNLKIGFEGSVTQMKLWLTCSQSVTVSALDRQGHCLAMAQTTALTVLDSSTYAQQGITLDTQGASLVRIDSKAPFVLSRLAVLHTLCVS